MDAKKLGLTVLAVLLVACSNVTKQDLVIGEMEGDITHRTVGSLGQEFGKGFSGDLEATVSINGMPPIPMRAFMEAQGQSGGMTVRIDKMTGEFFFESIGSGIQNGQSLEVETETKADGSSTERVHMGVYVSSMENE